ncbi:cytochrome P450 [Serendipita vermifera]|nr:cytochrome P450 [Serendipita vermifera]
MLPGSIPLLGHALDWFKDSSNVHQNARRWSKQLEPVSISLMGQRAYIVLHPRDVAMVHRSRTFQFDPIVQWSLHTHFGMSIKATHDISTDPDGQGSMYVNEHAFFRDALAPGANLTLLTNVFLRFLDADITSKVEEVRAVGGAITVDLLHWVRHTVGRSSSNAVVGSALLDQNPDLLNWYSQWQADFFKFSFGLPKWSIKRAYENRDRILTAFATHAEDPDAVWFVRAREEMMEARGVTGKDMAALTFAFWTGLQANAVPTAFWLLHFVSFSPGTIDRIREETSAGFDSLGHLVNIDHLLHHSPLLTSMYHETLRCTSGVVSMRKVTEDTKVGKYVFRKNAMVMLPGRPAHFAPDIWGDNVNQFDPERFFPRQELVDNTEVPIKHPMLKNLKPFGGGSTLCPGRFFACNEVLSYVAIVLKNFDLVVPDGQAIADIDTATPTIGTYLSDKPVFITVKLRGKV